MENSMLDRQIRKAIACKLRMETNIKFESKNADRKTYADKLRNDACGISPEDKISSVKDDVSKDVILTKWGKSNLDRRVKALSKQSANTDIFGYKLDSLMHEQCHKLVFENWTQKMLKEHYGYTQYIIIATIKELGYTVLKNADETFTVRTADGFRLTEK